SDGAVKTFSVEVFDVEVIGNWRPPVTYRAQDVLTSRIPGPDLNRFTPFVVSSSRDLVDRTPLEMKHECDA
ncbi:MAG: hypothetical protein ABMA15_30180, partial [Vicinamibacterales bacterium]